MSKLLAHDTLVGQVDIDGIEDDWSGVSDQKRRKMLQNRLNQRAYRNRLRQVKLAKAFGTDKIPNHQHGADPTASFHGHCPTSSTALRHALTFYPDALSDPIVREVIFFARDALWPTFSSCFPSQDSSCASSPLSEIWFHRVLAVPVMRHAVVVTTCLDLELLRGRRYGLTMLSSTNELIREIRWLLSWVRPTPSLDLDECKNKGHLGDGARMGAKDNGKVDLDLDDDLLFAVMHLAKANSIRNTSTSPDFLNPQGSRLKNLFKPPVFLRRLQYLHLWGLSDGHSANSQATLHLSTLEQLVALKGGLLKVKAPGFAEALHLFDVIESAKRLERPRFELPESSAEFLREQMPKLRKAAAMGVPKIRVEGEITQYLSRNSPLSEILEDIRVLCSWVSSLLKLSARHIEDGTRASPSADMASTEDIIVLRNLIVYRLLAYPPDPNNDAERMIWTAAVIFTHGAIFPLPYPVPMRILVQRLVEVLRERINNLKSQSQFQVQPYESPCPDPNNRLLVWAVMMGIMATSDTQSTERSFLLDHLSMYLRGSDLSSWTQLRRVLEAHLWVDWACDAGGLAVWEMLSTARLAAYAW